MSELMGYNHERSKYFQKIISLDLMHAFQNGFHLKKRSYSLLKLDNPALGHQIPRLVRPGELRHFRNVTLLAP